MHTTTKTSKAIKRAVSEAFENVVSRLALDECTLVKMLDERPSIVRELMSKKCDSIITETMLDYPDTICTRTSQGPKPYNCGARENQ